MWICEWTPGGEAYYSGKQKVAVRYSKVFHACPCYKEVLNGTKTTAQAVTIYLHAQHFKASVKLRLNSIQNEMASCDKILWTTQ